MSLSQHINDLYAAATPKRVEWLADKIAGYGDDGITALLKMVTSPDPRVATRAVQALELTHLSGDIRVAASLEHLLLTRHEVALHRLILPLIIQHAECGRADAREALNAYSGRGLAEVEEIANAMRKVVRS